MKKLNILELNRMALADYREADKVPFVVVLDNVRSLHNVGSVFRTSDAYRVESIYLCGVTATPPSGVPGAYSGDSLESFGFWFIPHKHISCWNCPMAMV